MSLGPIAQREIEQEFGRAFEEQHGLRLAPEQAADKTRQLAASPLDRRLQLEQRQLADFLGLPVDELL